MISKKITKIKIVLKQNWIAFALIILWFVVNFVIFYLATKNSFESFLILFFFKSHESLYGNFYGTFSEFIIFGLVFSLITVELFRKYNPVVTSREISKKYSDHVVIIGYSHIGQRIAEYLDSIGIKKVIVEENQELVDDLIIKEEPVIVDSPLSIDTLKDAGIQKAKAVFITSEDFETQLVVNSNVRKLNHYCKLVSRIFHDDIGELLAKTYNSDVISTSKYMSEVIYDKILKAHYKNVLLIGLNHISHRLIKKFKKNPQINYSLIEEDEEMIEDLMVDDFNIICGDPKDLSILEKAGIEKIDCAINIIPDVKNSILITKRIRDLNRSCKIITRFFLDSVAEILEKAPFRAEVISSSKRTLEIMKEKGYFNF